MRRGISAYMGVFIQILPWIFYMVIAIVRIWIVVFVKSFEETE